MKPRPRPDRPAPAPQLAPAITQQPVRSNERRTKTDLETEIRTEGRSFKPRRINFHE